MATRISSKVAKEIYDLVRNAPEGTEVIVNDADISLLSVSMAGPGTPYEGGRFEIKVQVTEMYPQTPPKCRFTTKIFHPNVSASGDICVNTLQKDWRQDLGISHLLVVIRCLLIAPNPDSALNEEAGKLLRDSFEDFQQRAKLMTKLHASCSTENRNPADKLEKYRKSAKPKKSTLKRL